MAQLPKRRDQVLREIEAAEARQQAITDTMCAPDFYERAARSEITALEQEQAALGPRLDALMAEWEELEREIEALAIR